MDTKVKTVQLSTIMYEKNIVLTVLQPMLNAMEHCVIDVNDGFVIRAGVPLYGAIHPTSIDDNLPGLNNGLLKDTRSVNSPNTVDTVYQLFVGLSSTGYSNRRQGHLRLWHSLLASSLMEPSSNAVKGFLQL